MLIMKITTTPLEGVIVIEPDMFEDNRGFFLETFHQEKYKEMGIDRQWVQDNVSFSMKGVLRGLHFQVKKPQAKLVQALQGEICDVVVDLRRDSPTFKKSFSILLTGTYMTQLFIPEGFAHGYCVISKNALFAYKCSELYSPSDEGGLLWSDPEIGIEWPFFNPILSPKDQKLPRLSEFPEDWLA
jgi:dTDP-4-dehydrorhamnose 3,5-epimerase